MQQHRNEKVGTQVHREMNGGSKGSDHFRCLWMQQAREAINRTAISGNITSSTRWRRAMCRNKLASFRCGEQPKGSTNVVSRSRSLLRLNRTCQTTT